MAAIASGGSGDCIRNITETEPMAGRKCLFALTCLRSKAHLNDTVLIWLN